MFLAILYELNQLTVPAHRFKSLAAGGQLHKITVDDEPYLEVRTLCNDL